MATGKAAGALAGLSGELADIVQRAAPSVVRVEDGSRLTATGTVWSADGVVVATSHGVERDEELAIELADGSRHAATLVGRDADTDVAVLQVAADAVGAAFVAVQPADPAEVRVGHLVLAMGRPGRFGLQATIGIVSARVESQSGGQPEYVLHTDAVLYPGFSGGPLVDANGRVIGIANRVFGRGAGVALGVPVVSHVVEALLAHGQVPRGYLGVGAQPVGLPEAQVQALQLGQSRGLLIVRVEDGSPAERGGLLLGDTLLAVEEARIEDVDDLRRRLRSLRAGQTVQLRILRAGEARTLPVELGKGGA